MANTFKRKYDQTFREGKRFKVATMLKVARNRYPRSYAYRKTAIKGRSQPELKYNDLAKASYVCDTTGTVTALNLIAVGDDNSTRDGRQVTLKSCHIQGVIQPTDATTSEHLARILVVWDSQANGALGTIATTTTGILTAADSVSNTQLNNRDRYTILRDLRFAMGGFSTTATQSYSQTPNVQMVNEYIKLNHKVTYGGTAADIASLNTGALLLVTVANVAAGAGSTFIGTTRVRFSDF